MSTSIRPDTIIDAAKSMLKLPEARTTVFDRRGSQLLVQRLRCVAFFGIKLIQTKQCPQASIQSIYCGHFIS
jgi:hypothetical protein